MDYQKMLILICVITFMGFTHCAKLDSLKYLPPDTRTVNKESFDQGLSAPTNSHIYNSGSHNTPQIGSAYFGKTISFESKPSSSKFNAGSQSAAQLQGSPFIPHGTPSAPSKFKQQSLQYGAELRLPSTSQQSSDSSSYSDTQTKNIYNNQIGSKFGNTAPAPQTSVGSQISSKPLELQRPQFSSYPSTEPQQVSNDNKAYPSSSVSGIASFNSANNPSKFDSQKSYRPDSSGSSTSIYGNKNVSPVGSYYSSITDSGHQSPKTSFQDRQLQPYQASASFQRENGFKSVNAASFPQAKYQPSSYNQIPILSQDIKNYGDGNYNNAYETGNGIRAQEQGEVQGDSSFAQGSYSYTSPEGEKVGISYTADENGYHPQGEHLPTSPPVPEAILKSLEYNKAHPEEESNEDSHKSLNTPTINQYKSSLPSTQIFGQSNKYLTPATSSEAVKQTTFSSPTQYSSSSSNDNPREINVSYISTVSPRYNAGDLSQLTGNSHTSKSYGYHNNAPTSQESSSGSPSTDSYRAYPSSTFGSQPVSRVQQEVFVNQPQNSGLINEYPAHSGFNSNLNGGKPNRSAFKSSQINGYQYDAPSASFGKSGPTTLQQRGSPDFKYSTFPQNGATEQQKIVGEFGQEGLREKYGLVKTPGVQAQDENGGYLY